MRGVGAMLALVGALATAPAAAQDSQARRYATSTAPMWEVGTLNRELSRLCQQSRFNQKRIAEMYIAFIGPQGQGITGIARRGYNLRDPGNLADPEKTYHFYSDGTTGCQVFVAP